MDAIIELARTKDHLQQARFKKKKKLHEWIYKLGIFVLQMGLLPILHIFTLFIFLKDLNCDLVRFWETVIDLSLFILTH